MTYSVADRELDEQIKDMRLGLGLGPCGAGMHLPENTPDDDPPPFAERDVPGFLEAQKLRAELIAKIERSPKWREKWHAGQDLDIRIEQLCEAKGLKIRPWEPAPWHSGATGPALKLRRQLIAEIEAGDAAREGRQERRRERSGTISNGQPGRGRWWGSTGQREAF